MNVRLYHRFFCYKKDRYTAYIHTELRLRYKSMKMTIK